MWLCDYEEPDDRGRDRRGQRSRPRHDSGPARQLKTPPIAWGRDATWIVYQEATSLIKRLDPATGDVVAEIPVGPVETYSAENGQVWVANETTARWRGSTQPRTRVTDTIEVTRSPKQLVLGGGSLWVADARDPVVAGWIRRPATWSPSASAARP